MVMVLNLINFMKILRMIFESSLIRIRDYKSYKWEYKNSAGKTVIPISFHKSVPIDARIQIKSFIAETQKDFKCVQLKVRVQFF